MGLTYNTGLYNAAAEHYGVDDPVMTKIPRQKFQFMVEITINETVLLIDESYGRQFYFHRVQGVSLPNYQHTLVKTNQYNRIRHVPARSEVTPATITFYDTKDNHFQYMLQSYAQHYFHGLNLDSRDMAAYDTITQSMSGVFGAKTIPSSQRFFFPSIRILSKDTANSGREITMYNCMIASVNHDRLDYGDSAPVMWSVQFQPEHVNIEAVGDNTNSQGAAAPVQSNVNQQLTSAQRAAISSMNSSTSNITGQLTSAQRAAISNITPLTPSSFIQGIPALDARTGRNSTQPVQNTIRPVGPQ